MPASITYEQVFGVKKIGDELTYGQAVKFTPCPAVKSLRGLLMAHAFLIDKVQGTGPLFREWDGNKHEFNRHHAGLAVDIMLSPGSPAEVALGQQLVQLFRRHVGTMKWRSMIYQNVTFGSGGGAKDGGDHMDHIHIDWHNTANVEWHQPISTVPLRKGSAVIQCPVMQNGKIAKKITWTVEAETDFSSNPAITTDLAEIMGKHHRAELKKETWNAASLTGKTAFNSRELAGTWHVAIGNWRGLFVFDAAGNVAWMETDRSKKHPGRWSVAGNRLQWKFRDPGDFRTFTTPIPLDSQGTNGTILPAGQGWFTMKKTSAAVA